MTLIVAMKYKEGVVIASDSRLTYGEEPLMREESPKIEILGKFAITGAGLVGPLERIINEIVSTFKSVPSPSFEEVVLKCEDIMYQFYEKYAERIKKDTKEEEDWSILLASKDRIYYVLPTGWSEEEPNYTSDGSGHLYAEYILKQRFKPNMSEKEAKELTVYTISQTSRIDPNVGGKIQMILIDKNSLRQVGDDEINEILESIKELAFEAEREIQNIVHEIVEKRRWINTVSNQKFDFELFEQNEFAISEIQKSCKNETDFTSRISALALLVDGIRVSNLDKQIVIHPTPGSLNVLEAFLKEKYQDFDITLIVNLRDIMTLRSKKMPIHEDDPKLIQVILKWEHKIPPNWASLWKQALMRYLQSLSELEKLLSS